MFQELGLFQKAGSVYARFPVRSAITNVCHLSVLVVTADAEVGWDISHLVSVMNVNGIYPELSLQI